MSTPVIADAEAERRQIPLAIRAWLEVGFTDAEKRMLAVGVLAAGVLGDNLDRAIDLGCKLGIADLIAAEAEQMSKLAARRVGKEPGCSPS